MLGMVPTREWPTLWRLYRQDSSMSSTSLLAFVVTPIVVVVLGWGAVLINSWHMKRSKGQE